MKEFIANDKDKIIMKLLHYLITEQNYSPIVLQGVRDEIWLENMDNEYKIIRINSKSIRNSEQLDRDLFITERIIKAIKKKSLSFSMPALNILLDLEQDIPIPNKKAIESIIIKDVKDIKKNDILKEIFPSIIKMKPAKGDIVEFSKITNDINEKNKEKYSKTNEIFKPKKPVITISLIIINILMFLIMSIIGNGSEDTATLIFFGANVAPLVEMGQYYRLITAGFIHIGIFHLLINCYSLYIIGSQVESYFGRIKFLAIYFFSMICGNLLSMALLENGISAGASGAIFGLLGAFLYFGYHYRAYIGDTIIRQIVPVIILNLLLGFMSSGIDNGAHIGGLIGGFLITYALGIKYRTKQSQIINGTIMSVIFFGFLIYLAFFI